VSLTHAHIIHIVTNEYMKGSMDSVSFDSGSTSYGPVAHCHGVIYVACREGHNSFPTTATLSGFHSHLYGIYRREGESRRIYRPYGHASHSRALMALEESIDLVSIANKEHRMDAIRRRAALIR
jgi:hypothetical protein